MTWRALSMARSILWKKMALMLLSINLFAVLFFCTCLRAQEDAYVDARIGSEPARKISSGKASGGIVGCGDGCTVPESVKVEVVSLISLLKGFHLDSGDSYVHFVDHSPGDDDRSLVPVRSLEWTIQVINTSQKILSIPTSLSWSREIEKSGNGESAMELRVDLFGKLHWQGRS